MAERNYPVPEAPVYEPEIRALQDSDPASASTVFNPLIERLIANIHAVKLMTDGKADNGSMQAALRDIANTFNTINMALNGKAASNHSHTAAQVGAAAASHSHTKSQITDFPSSMAPTAHNHSAANITAGILPIARGGLGNDSGYVRAGQETGTTIGYAATAEGEHTTASGDHSHAEGWRTLANGRHSHAGGNGTTADNENSCVVGHYNKALTTGGAQGNKVGDAFVVGNGTAMTVLRSNAFRITFAGQTYGLAAFNTSGADYAEYFEWLDANPENEDRVGFFVTLQGDKIEKANAGDYLLGIVSANPCIIGNADEDWLGRYEHDEFGRFKTIEVETQVTKLQHKEVPVLDENGEPTGEVTIETEEVPTGEVIHGWDYQQNPDYDNTQQYIERKDRPEWAAVGMLGVLAVRDDGSCKVNGFCQCAEGGIATAAAKYIPGQTYRVLARVTENIVKVVFR